MSRELFRKVLHEVEDCQLALRVKMAGSEIIPLQPELIFSYIDVWGSDPRIEFKIEITAVENEFREVEPLNELALIKHLSIEYRMTYFLIDTHDGRGPIKTDNPLDIIEEFFFDTFKRLGWIDEWKSSREIEFANLSGGYPLPAIAKENL